MKEFDQHWREERRKGSQRLHEEKGLLRTKNGYRATESALGLLSGVALPSSEVKVVTGSCLELLERDTRSASTVMLDCKPGQLYRTVQVSPTCRG
jgi:hypothetical protein